jgi:hypothetical protein
MLLRLVKYNHSFSSYDDLTGCLKYALPDNDVVRDMSSGATKCGYSLVYRLGPLYQAELVKDVQREYFSLIIDETTTQQNKKQLDILVKYWSLQDHRIYRISTRYIRSCFPGRATADDMNAGVLSVLANDGLSLCKS